MVEINCSDTRVLLADYSVGGLRWRIKKRVKNHLRKCESCARDLRLLTDSADMVKRLPEPTPPDNLWARIFADIATLESPVSARRRPVGAVAAVAAVGALAAVLAWIVVKPSARQVVVTGQTPVASANFYVRTHLVAPEQEFMFSTTPMEPMLDATGRHDKVVSRKR